MSAMTHEAVQTAMTVADMTAEQQDLFFKVLAASGELTNDEIRAFQIVTGYFRLQMNPDIKKAMKEEMAKQFYEKFNKMEAKA